MASVLPATPSATIAPAAPALSQHLRPLSIESAPTLCAALLFAGGILWAHFAWRLPALLALAITLLALFALLFRRGRAWAALWATAACWLLLGFLCAEVQPRPPLQKSLRLLADSTQRPVAGTVVRVGPIRTQTSNLPYSARQRVEQVQHIDLAVAAVGAQAISGGLRMTVYAPAEVSFPHIACGQTLSATVAMHPPDRYLDRGAWESSAYMLGQGIGALASLKSEQIAALAPGRASLSCWLHGLQQAGSSRILALADARRRPAWLPPLFTLDADDAAMLTAMVTGDRDWLRRPVRTGFERTGSFHLLVVSGLHLAIFAGILTWLAQRLRLPRLVATPVIIATAFAYALFTGYGQPVQRSFWMVSLYLLGRLLWRERSALNAIGFAAICLLVTRPDSLFDAGFQMTVLSVLATGGLAAPIAERSFAPYLRALRHPWRPAGDAALPPRVAQALVTLRLLAGRLRPLTGKFVACRLFPALLRLSLRCCELVLVSLAIEMAMILPMALYFHRITVAALPVNLLVVPLLGLLLPAVLFTFAVLLCAPAVAWMPAALSALLLHAVTFVIRGFSAFSSADLRVATPSLDAIILWSTSLGLALWLVRRPRWGALLCTACLTLGAVAALYPRPLPHAAGILEIDALDVGQGDSILLVTPQGKTLLIDAGGSPIANPDTRFEIGEEVVSAYLWDRGIRRLDAVALTHAHADHVGGMRAVLENFRPREFWVGVHSAMPAYRSVTDEAGRQGAQVRILAAGDHFDFGGTSLRVLAPEATYHPAETPTNNDSLVLHASLAHTSVLLEGDAEKSSEAAMLARGGLQADLLKIGHHGSLTSTNPAFLAAVAPRYSIISVGRRNGYGHPRHEILDELERAQVLTYRTDLLGASRFFLDGRRISVAPWQ